uniref:Protein-glucosylgalactosylhydroxylysine glucosidase n=1 Tax=Xenopus tropicalis TaxID=8364 RepID=A0A6I8RFB3_XENTR
MATEEDKVKVMSPMEDGRWIFSSSSLPSDPRLMATLANGYLGTRVYGDVFHVNGVYNGAGGNCHRAEIPSPCFKLVAAKEILLTENFALNIKRGTFIHTLQCPSFTATHQTFAHRSYCHLLVNIVTLTSTQGTHPVSVDLQSKFKIESPDLNLQEGPDFREFKYIFGSTLESETESCPVKSIHMIWTPVPPYLELTSSKEKTWVFLAAVCETEKDVKEKFAEGLTLIAENELCSSHERAWAEFWAQSSIEMDSSLSMIQSVNGCLYYLLSSLPQLGYSGEFYGISPGGLSNGRSKEDYWGHVFWDQGAKFPWESALTGCEVCPDNIYGDQEIHINGDVLLAFQQYYYLTKDLDFFASEGGWEVVSSVAEYWCSRVVWSKEEQNYHLNGVMPPDEYHWDVNNSAYTNALVQTSLNFAIDLAVSLEHHIPDSWKDVASKIKVPFDPKINYHPEFDGYEIWLKVKQADVVLMGYPMMFPMTIEQRMNDLQMYESRTDPDGPAMTWSMFAIGWMELKKIQVAQQQLKKCFANVTEPFKIWTENADGSGAVNFLTGMGGFLQAILFGYTGLRIAKAHLSFDPILPDDIPRLHITGVFYLGNKLNFTLSSNIITIEVTSVLKGQNCTLEIYFSQLEPSLPLYIGRPVSFPTRAGQVQLKQSQE